MSEFAPLPSDVEEYSEAGTASSFFTSPSFHEAILGALNTRPRPEDGPRIDTAAI